MKQIKDYDNYYIDENGNVYNSTTKKYLKGSYGEHGYKYYRLSKDGKKKMFYAHRLVAEYYLENSNNLPVVNHIDGNKLNNHFSNLEWVTYSENTKHWRDNSHKVRKQTEYYSEDLENEIWKPFGNYYISSKGRVRHKKGNLLHPSLACGYYKVRLSENGLTSDYMIHKLVYSLFKNDYNPDDKNLVIDHIDGNKLNNHVSNLEWCTLSENQLHSIHTFLQYNQMLYYLIQLQAESISPKLM